MMQDKRHERGAEITMGPASLGCDIGYLDCELNPRSRKDCLSSKWLKGVLGDLQKLPITSVSVSCLHYPLSNLVVAYLIKKKPNISVWMHYDGLIHLVNPQVSMVDRMKDIVTACLARRRGLFYIRRRSLLTGADLAIFRYIPIAPPQISTKKNYASSPRAAEQKPGVVIISQQTVANQSWYDHLLCSTIANCEKKFEHKQIFLLDRPSEQNGMTSQLPTGISLLKRGLGETAEQAILRASPDVVVAHTSSTLVNLRASGYERELYYFGLEDWCSHNGEKKLYSAYKKVFERFDVRPLTCLRRDA